MESNVLLCCINPCTFTKTLEERDLFCLFSHFGRVSNALIFSQKVQIKAFIEFARAADLEAALAAIPRMSFPFGKVRVFRSKKENVDKKMQFRFKRKTSVHSEDLQSRDISSAHELQPTRLQLKATTVGALDLNFVGISTAESSNPQSHPTLVSDKDYHSTSTESVSGNSQVKDVQSSERGKNAIGFKNKASAATPKPKVIIINGINLDVVTGKFLLNLYSCFGNIVKMLLNKEQSYALIEFETEPQACFAIACTKSIMYFNSALKIKMSKYTSLNFKSLDKEKNENLTHFYGNSKLYRHPKNVQLECNPFSNTVTFKEVPESVDEVVLFTLVSQVHQPTTITKLTPVDQSEKKIYVIKFSDEVRAAEVLSVFHNKKVDDNFLKVNFVACDSTLHI